MIYFLILVLFIFNVVFAYFLYIQGEQIEHLENLVDYLTKDSIMMSLKIQELENDKSNSK